MRYLRDLGKTLAVAFVMLLLLGSEIVANLFQSVLSSKATIMMSVYCSVLNDVMNKMSHLVRCLHCMQLPSPQVFIVFKESRLTEVKEKVKGYMSDLCGLYAQLAHVIKDKPGQYYRYHDLWRNQTSTVVFVLAFLHWLDTGGLLTHTETEALLNLDPAVFGIDLEDYLIGLCSFSNELPRYVVNRVTAGDYNCPKEVSTFLGDLYTAFRTLNLRNDHLRKRFDGIKYDLKKVEEVLYDVKIRGLLNGPSLQATATGHESNVATSHQ